MESSTADLVLRDGSTVTIRPIGPDDAGRLREIWEGMSELSRRRRFLVPTRDMSDEDLRYLVDIDHKRHDALLALDENGRALAEARYVRTPGDRESAEVAVVVVDDWHHRGLATAMLDRLTERARENGIEHYSAIVSADNEIVLEALERAGATRTGETDEGEIEFSIPFPAEDGIGDRLETALRAAAMAPREFVTMIARRFGAWRRSL